MSVVNLRVQPPVGTHDLGAPDNADDVRPRGSERLVVNEMFGWVKANAKRSFVLFRIAETASKVAPRKALKELIELKT